MGAQVRGRVFFPVVAVNNSWLSVACTSPVHPPLRSLVIPAMATGEAVLRRCAVDLEVINWLIAKLLTVMASFFHEDFSNNINTGRRGGWRSGFYQAIAARVQGGSWEPPFHPLLPRRGKHVARGLVTQTHGPSRHEQTESPTGTPVDCRSAWKV